MPSFASRWRIAAYILSSSPWQQPSTTTCKQTGRASPHRARPPVTKPSHVVPVRSTDLHAAQLLVLLGVRAAPAGGSLRCSHVAQCGEKRCAMPAQCAHEQAHMGCARGAALLTWRIRVLPPPEGEDFLDLVDLVCCQRLKPRLGVESVEVAALR